MKTDTTQTPATELNSTSDRLVDSAIELLHTQAYHAVGVQTLCEAAGVRKGSFYHFFGSKEDLTLAAIDRSWEMFRSDVIEPIFAVKKGDEARVAAIREACLQPVRSDHVDAHRPHGCIFGRLAAGISENEPLLRDRLAEIFGERAEMLGGGTKGWSALADIQGRLVLAFAVKNPEVIEG
jgi:TetR/AcrR family transcriptional repressor of nem operon